MSDECNICPMAGHCKDRQYPKCTKCQGELFYVQQSTEIWRCNDLPDKEGHIELLHLVDSIATEDKPYLECSLCGFKYWIESNGELKPWLDV